MTPVLEAPPKAENQKPAAPHLSDPVRPLETFFEKFTLFADAPDAVAKMRELVLQLAVTGKLVAQDKCDEPASSLLKSTEAERAKFIAAKRIKSRPTSPVDQDEQPFDLPSNWAWARLSDVGYELGQKVPDKRFTYIDVGGIDSDIGRISDRVEKLEPGDAPSRARKLVARGTVIYSTVRPYLLNIAIVDQDFDPEPIASTAFGILHPFEGINNRYLFYWLRSAPFTAYVQAGMKGMAYPAINDEKFYSGFVALPPLAEQKRIVAKVDELMALCDRLEAQQQERETRHAALARATLSRFAEEPTSANLNFLFHQSYPIPPTDLRKSILTLAVQGKLVPQDPNDESVSKWAGRSPAKGGVDELPMLPETWSYVRLKEVCERVSVAHVGPTSQYYCDKESGIPFVRSQNVRPKRLDPEGLRYITKEFHRALRKSQLREGDLLFVRVGANRGDCCRVPSGFADLNGANIVFARPKRDLVEYLELYCQSSLARTMLMGMTTGSAQGVINTKSVAELMIALPPLAEQRRIVAKVDQLMALVDQLESQLAASRATAANLLEALLAELTTAS
jgi:type I restriction enzyme S subunit